MPPGPPSASIDIATRTISRVEYHSIPRDDAAIPRLMKKYGKPQKFGRGPINDADERLSMSKVFLENDGFTSTTIYFYRGRDIIRAAPVNIRSSSPRELAVQIALESLGAETVDGALFATEMWIGGSLDRADGLVSKAATQDAIETDTGHPQPFYDSDPVGGCLEALAVYAVTAAQGVRSLLVQYHRADGRVSYTPLLDSTDPRNLPPMLLRPLLRHWAKAGQHIELVPGKV